MALTFDRSATSTNPLRLAGATGRRGLLLATVGLVLAAAVGAVEVLPGRTFEPDLGLVIGFMALLKSAIAALVVALLWWRAAAPIHPRLYGLALAALAPMVAAPWMVLNGTLLGVSSLLFQGGLVALGLVAWREHAQVTRAARG